MQEKTIKRNSHSRQTRLGQHDISGTTSGIGSTLDGNTNVGTGQSRGIVGTITSHSAEMAESLETIGAQSGSNRVPCKKS